MNKTHLLLFSSENDLYFFIAIVIVISILMFFLIRNIMLWYWKITELIKNQKEQIRLLRKIAGENQADPETKDLVEKLRQ